MKRARCAPFSHAVALVLAGSGDTTFGDPRIGWRQRDIFTVPPGHWVSHRAGPDGARLFVVSDRDALDRLGLCAMSTAIDHLDPSP